MALHIRSSLQALTGVRNVRVSVDRVRSAVTFDEEKMVKGARTLYGLIIQGEREVGNWRVQFGGVRTIFQVTSCEKTTEQGH